MIIKLIKVFLLLQGALMAATLEHIGFKEKNIPIVFENSSYVPIISLQLVFTNAGHLSSEQDSLADLSAKLLNEGTKKDGSIKFANKLDSKAIDIHASLGRESFVIELSALKSEFAYGVERLIELLKDPNYTSEALDLVKRQKIGWIHQKRSDFDYISATKLRSILFEGTSLAREYNGTQESVSKITLKDIQKFIETNLGYSNLIAVVGGDLSSDESKEYVQSIINELPLGSTKPIDSVEVIKTPKTLLTYEDTEQAYIFFGAPFNFSYKEDEQYLAQIAEYLLGGAGFGSRLMDEIRVRRGLTYGVYSSLRRTKLVSYLSGYMQTKLTTQDEAKEVIVDVVKKFVKDGITKEELDATKKFLLGSQPLRTETLSQRLNRAYNEYYYGRPLGFTIDQIEKIENVTLDEINDFIKSHTELTKISFSIVTNK